MEKLTINLSFFAQHMMADEKKMKYVIIVRKYDDPMIKNYYGPAISVDGIDNKVYSLFDGRFIDLGNRSDGEVITLSTTYIKQEDGSLLLVDNKSGTRVHYTYEDFIEVFGDRVINPALFE